MKHERSRLLGVAKLGAEYNLRMFGVVKTVVLTLSESGEHRTTGIDGTTRDEVANAAQAVAVRNGAMVAAVIVAGVGSDVTSSVFIHVQQRGDLSEAWCAPVQSTAAGKSLGPWKRATDSAMTLIPLV